MTLKKYVNKASVNEFRQEMAAVHAKAAARRYYDTFGVTDEQIKNFKHGKPYSQQLNRKPGKGAGHIKVADMQENVERYVHCPHCEALISDSNPYDSGDNYKIVGREEDEGSIMSGDTIHCGNCDKKFKIK